VHGQGGQAAGGQGFGHELGVLDGGAEGDGAHRVQVAYAAPSLLTHEIDARVVAGVHVGQGGEVVAG
jgi:hypothetical protein